MYQLINKGVVIETTDELQFVKTDGVTVSGAPRFVPCEESEAECVSVFGVLYSLENISVCKIDGAKRIAKAEENAALTDALALDHEYRLILLETGVSE